MIKKIVISFNREDGGVARKEEKDRLEYEDKYKKK